MLINSVFDVIIYFIQRFILPVMPTNFVAYSISDFTSDLTSIEGIISKSLSGVSNVFPADLVLACLTIVILAEIALFGVKAIFYIINVFRGSGA